MANSNIQPTFEEVPLDTFYKNTQKDDKIDCIISKIANSNNTVITGIKSLLSENLIFNSFDRALPLLLMAKNEQHLQKVEAALQVTSNEIKNYITKGSSYITHKKASLYLYTLQYLILNLDKWKFPNKKTNSYKPSILIKLEEVRFKCRCLNIKDSVIHRECFSSSFQQPYDENLRSFEFLDEQALNNFIKNLHKYEITRNSEHLYSKPKLSKFEINTQKIYIKNILSFLKAELNVADLNLDYYTRNFHAINEVIAKYIGSNDLYQICILSDMIKQNLESQNQIDSMLNRYSGSHTKGI